MRIFLSQMQITWLEFQWLYIDYLIQAGTQLIKIHISANFFIEPPNQNILVSKMTKSVAKRKRKYSAPGLLSNQATMKRY